MQGNGGGLLAEDSLDFRQYIEENIRLRQNIGRTLLHHATNKALSFLTLDTDDPNIMHKQAKMLSEITNIAAPVPSMAFNQTNIHHTKPVHNHPPPMQLSREEVIEATRIAIQEQDSVDEYKQSLLDQKTALSGS